MFDYPPIYIYAEKVIQWALKAIYPDCRTVSDFNSLKSCSNRDFMLMQVRSIHEIQKLLWDTIRIQWQKLSPVIVLGYQSEKEFYNEPFSLVFQERHYEYRYLSLPIGLIKLINALTQMQPIYDTGTLKSHIKRYASLSGLIKTHLHHVGNLIYRNDLDGCCVEFSKIQAILQFGEPGDISPLFERFFKNSTLDLAEKIKINIEELIDDK